MREIKFRAWVKEELRFRPFSVRSGLYSASSDAPIMQYTGLKDKNGVEIYEGDIVRHWSYGYNCGGMGDKQVFSVVEWNEAGACFENCFDRRYGVEVVGTIYENPELLEY